MQRFGSEPPREESTQRLQRVFDLASGTGKLRKMFVWGSYVTAKPAPQDVDVMLIMASDFRSEDCDEQTRSVFDGERAESELGATVLWTREDVPGALLDAFLDQWQIGRGGIRRGIVQIVL